MNNDNKVFMNPSFCREKIFDNGGRVINISIPNVAEFCDKFIEHANSDGSINIEIKEKRNVSDNGTTHYIQLSTYQPKVEPQTNEGQRGATPNRAKRRYGATIQRKPRFTRWLWSRHPVLIF